MHFGKPGGCLEDMSKGLTRTLHTSHPPRVCDGDTRDLHVKIPQTETAKWGFQSKLQFEFRDDFEFPLARQDENSPLASSND